MTKIFLLSLTEYPYDLLYTFALSLADLEQIAINNYCHWCGRAKPEDIIVTGCFEDGTVTITDDGDDTVYHIFTYERV